MLVGGCCDDETPPGDLATPTHANCRRPALERLARHSPFHCYMKLARLCRTPRAISRVRMHDQVASCYSRISSDADSSDARDEPHLSHTTSSRARGGMGTEMNTRARAVVGGEGDAPEGEIL